jgi:colicin import membrane protein
MEDNPKEEQMTKALFSPSEWKLLLNAPQWVYAALTAAERGSISTRRSEAKALKKFMSSYKTNSPLVKEIIAGQDEADDKVKGSRKEAEKTLTQVGTLLERKAGGDEGDAVRDFLKEAGEAIAEATREGLFGDRLSRKEEEALASIEAALKATEADKERRQKAARAKAEREARHARELEARAKAERKKKEAEEAEAKKAAEAERRKREAEAERRAKELAAERKVREAAAKRKAKAEAEAAAKAKAEAEAKAKAEAEAKAKAEAAAKAKA